MEISELQISQVNKQIEALIKAESFYGKKLEEAGITRISTPEDFKKLPFSEKKDLRDAYPLGLMTAPESEIDRRGRRGGGGGGRARRGGGVTGQSCSSVVMSLQVSRIWIVFRSHRDMDSGRQESASRMEQRSWVLWSYLWDREIRIKSIR